MTRIPQRNDRVVFVVKGQVFNTPFQLGMAEGRVVGPPKKSMAGRLIIPVHADRNGAPPAIVYAQAELIMLINGEAA